MASGLGVLLVLGALAAIGWLVGGGAGVIPDGIAVLRYRPMFRALGVVCVGIMPVVFAAAVAIGNQMGLDSPGRTYGLLGLGGAFLVFGLWPLLEGFGASVTLDDDGVAHRSWTGRLTRIDWDEVERVVNRETWSRFELTGAGKRVKVSHMMGGLELLACECKRRLPREAYKGAFKMLNKQRAAW